MKISAALAFFSVAYVSGAVGVIHKTSTLANNVGAVAGSPIPGGPLPSINAVSSGSQVVTTATSSSTTPFNPIVPQGTTTQQTTGTQTYPGFSVGGFYNRYFPGGYLGYDTGMYPGFHGGAYLSYLRWAYPGLNAGLYPGFLRPLYPGHHGLSGGAYLRYLSGVYPGLFDGAYGRLYGSWPFPTLYPVSRPGSHPAQAPGPFPGVSATPKIGTSTVSQSQVVASGVVGPALTSGQQQNILQGLPGVGLRRPRAE